MSRAKRTRVALSTPESRDARVWCPRCGWTFTVHDIPAAAACARPPEWFCPHCGKPTTEQPSPTKRSGT